MGPSAAGDLINRLGKAGFGKRPAEPKDRSMLAGMYQEQTQRIEAGPASKK